jgi:hypothetical protein
MHPARWSNRLGIIMTYERYKERRAIAGWSDLLPAAPPGAEPDRKQKAAGASGELEHDDREGRSKDIVPALIVRL